MLRAFDLSYTSLRINRIFPSFVLYVYYSSGRVSVKSLR
jgi:hypothetical protein